MRLRKCWPTQTWMLMKRSMSSSRNKRISKSRRYHKYLNNKRKLGNQRKVELKKWMMKTDISKKF